MIKYGGSRREDSLTKNPEIMEMMLWATNEEWFVFNPASEGQYRLTDNAPQRAREAFNQWLEYYQKNT